MQRLREAASANQYARGGRGGVPARNPELMPAFLECARSYASGGEQVRVLKEVFGEYRDPSYF